MAIQALFDAAPSGKVELSCTACGKKFLRYRGHVKGTREPFCSKECRNTGRMFACFGCGIPVYRRRYQLDKIESGEVEVWCSQRCLCKHKRLERICATCGGSFSRPRSQFGREGGKLFCSRECQNGYRLEQVKCFWPGCNHVMPARLYTKSGVRLFKTELTKKGSYTRHPICRHHRGICIEHLGANYRPNGRLRWFDDLDYDMGCRAIGGRMSRLIIFQKSSGGCASCGAEQQFSRGKDWHIDHIVPVYKGGKTTFNNLQMLCVPCHDQKTAFEKSEVGKLRGMRSATGRWMTHPEKDALIAELRAEIDDLRTKLAQAA